MLLPILAETYAGMLLIMVGTTICMWDKSTTETQPE